MAQAEQHFFHSPKSQRGGWKAWVHSISCMPIPSCWKGRQIMACIHQKHNRTGQGMEKCFYWIHSSIQRDSLPRNQSRSTQAHQMRWAEPTRPASTRLGAHTRRRKALGEHRQEANQNAVCVHSSVFNRVCVREGVDDHFYSLHREMALSDARRKHNVGAGLSLHDRRAQSLELTHKEKKLLARQVKMLCVYTQVMVIVYACVEVLIATSTRCAGRLQLVPFGTNTSKALGWANTTRSTRLGAHTRRRKALGEASQNAVRVHSTTIFFFF